MNFIEIDHYMIEQAEVSAVKSISQCAKNLALAQLLSLNLSNLHLKPVPLPQKSDSLRFNEVDESDFSDENDFSLEMKSLHSDKNQQDFAIVDAKNPEI